MNPYLSLIDDFKPNVHVCTGSSGSGKSLFLTNLILNLLNKPNIFPEPCMEIEKLSYLLNAQKNIFVFSEDSTDSLLSLVKINIENFPKNQHESLVKKFIHYVKLTDIVNLDSYCDITNIISQTSSFPNNRYIFIDGSPIYKNEEKVLIAHRAKDLQRFMSSHLHKDFVFITSQESKSPMSQNPYNSSINPSFLGHAASTIVTVSKKTSKNITCNISKNRSGLLNQQFSLKVKS